MCCWRVGWCGVSFSSWAELFSVPRDVFHLSEYLRKLDTNWRCDFRYNPGERCAMLDGWIRDGEEIFEGDNPTRDPFNPKSSDTTVQDSNGTPSLSET